MLDYTIFESLKKVGIQVTGPCSVVFFDFLGHEASVSSIPGGVDFKKVHSRKMAVNEFDKALKDFTIDSVKESGLVRLKKVLESNITTALAMCSQSKQWITFQLDPLFFDNLFMARVKMEGLGTAATYVEIEWSEKFNVFVREQVPKIDKFFLKSLKRGSVLSNDEVLFLIKKFS